MGLIQTSLLRPRYLFAALLVMAAIGLEAPAAAAQDDGSGEFEILVRLCLEPGCTELEDLVEPVDGVGVEVLDADTQQSIGTCTTGDDSAGACVVTIPDGTSSVTVILDESSIPDGYVTTENPGTADLANTNQYPFLLMPEDGFPPDDDDPAPTDPGDDDGDEGEGVTQLPETGTGPGSEPSTGVALSGLVALTSLLGLGVMVARRALHR